MSTPIELVRKKVLSLVEYMIDSKLETLTESTLINLADNDMFTYADIKEIILDMISSGILTCDNGLISKNNKYVDVPESPDYEVKKYISYDKKIDLTGENRINSVGSEDFFYNLAKLNEGDEVLVELAPEPNNEYDENAVAIMYDGKIIGYFERRNSKLYHEMIVSHNQQQESVIAKAKVLVAKQLDNLKYVIVSFKEF